MNKPALEWIVGDDTGISSVAIWAAMMGVKPSRNCTPCDPADFGRCYRLLKAVPEWEPLIRNIGQKLEYAPTVNGEKRPNLWQVFGEYYPQMRALYEKEKDQQRAPELYAFMKKLGF